MLLANSLDRPICGQKRLAGHWAKPLHYANRLILTFASDFSPRHAIAQTLRQQCQNSSFRQVAGVSD